ncbi:hypothetical protein NECAME_12491 [Necator americanus]|uniref:Uncharacterized protein n=1 Tax=Necator americanus TaxID=51031 RepID=W2T268_NECAM|nr:hypothetical protein NECAME_12491 [Necator americanus]ETN75301.1 hypothetical protein NECAME_12491 [Necator americanus]
MDHADQRGRLGSFMAKLTKNESSKYTSSEINAYLFARTPGPGVTMGYIRWPSSYATGPQPPHYTAVPIQPHPLLNAQFMKPLNIPVSQTSLKCKKCNCCVLHGVGVFGSVQLGGKGNSPTYVTPPAPPIYPQPPHPTLVVPSSVYITSPPSPVYPVAPPPAPIVPEYPLPPTHKPMPTYPTAASSVGYVTSPPSAKCGAGKWSECCLTFCSV